MANLETLELTINANATSASRGLSSLIDSLTNLTTKLNEAFGSMSKLNAEIRRLGNYGNTIKMPNIGRSSGGKRASGSSRTSSVFRTSNGSPLPANARVIDPSGIVLQIATPEQIANLKNVQTAADGAAQGIKNVGSEAGSSSKNSVSFAEGMRRVRGTLTDMIPKLKMFSRILRIMSTMLIRMAAKALFKGIKEGFQNFYQYASLTGGTFAKQMDGVYSTWNQLKNQMGASLGSAFAAAIPVINSLANAAMIALNALSQLFALLTGKSTWTQATSQMSNYGDAINSAAGGGKKLKEVLAQFDELNVLSSDSGGGGGGGGITADYADMFQEVAEFDERIRAIAQVIKDTVKFVKEHFDEILIAIAAIGLGVAAWKIANEFAESLALLSSIATWIALGTTITLTIVATWKLTNQYLNTGNIGWLIADVITTAIGSTLAWYVAKKLIGGEAASIALSFTLTFSAITGIIALLGDADVSALDVKSLTVAVENALKVGAAAAFLIKTFGEGTAMQSLAGGAGVALITFGLVIGLKALLDEKIGLFSLGNVVSSVITAATTLLGLKLVGLDFRIAGGISILTFAAMIGLKAVLDDDVKMFTIPHVVAAILTSAAVFLGAKTIGASLYVAGGAAVLWLGAMVGLKALLDENVQMFSTWNIIATILTASTTLLGIKMISGSWTIAGGAAIIAFGAMVGLKAMLDKNVEMFSTTSIVSALVSAASIAIGVKLISGSWMIAAGAAVLTIAALIAVRAFTNKGNIEVDPNLIRLTDEQVNQFVRSNMFTIDPEIMIKVTANNIANLDMNRKEIEDKLAGLIGTLEVVRLGIASGDDYKTIHDEILGTSGDGSDGLIGKISSWITEAENSGKLVLKFTPRLVGETEEEQKQWYTDFGEGWELIKGHMKSLGEQLAEQFVEGEKDKIKEGREGVVATLVDEIATISEILAGTDVSTEANIGFELTLNDIDSSSFNQAMEEYGKYKKQITAAADEFVKTAYYNQARQVAALKYMLELEPNNEEIKTALATAQTTLENMKTNMDGIIDDYTKEWAEPGRSMLREWIEKNFELGSINSKWMENKIKQQFGHLGFKQALSKLLADEGFDMTKIDINDFLEVGGWDLLSKDLQGKILQNTKMTAETISTLKNQLRMNADEIISFSNWDKMSTGLKLEFIKGIVNAFGAEEALAAAKRAGIDVQQTILEGMTSDNDSNVKAAKKLAEQIDAELKKNPVNVQADASVKVNVEIDALIKIAASVANGVLHGTQSVINNVSSYINSIGKHAQGAYGIPNGDLFIANEQGAELVGSIGGKTSVANQGQIIEGIRQGVADANGEQNVLLRQQNDLLMRILQKEANINFGASASFGRTAKRSIDMYNSAMGG